MDEQSSDEEKEAPQPIGLDSRWLETISSLGLEMQQANQAIMRATGIPSEFLLGSSGSDAKDTSENFGSGLRRLIAQFAPFMIPVLNDICDSNFNKKRRRKAKRANYLLRKRCPKQVYKLLFKKESLRGIYRLWYSTVIF